MLIFILVLQQNIRINFIFAEKISDMDEIKYNEDKNSIKIWPYLDDVSQAIVPYSSKKLNNKWVVNFNLSEVQRAKSSILAITLSKIVTELVDKNYSFRVIMPENNNIENLLQCSGFLSILDEYLKFPDNIRVNLFETIEKPSIRKSTQIFSSLDEKTNVRTTSFPIFHLKYNPDNERESVEKFSNWLDDNILSVLDRYNVQTDILYSVLTEIAKNSQDHTENDAFFGIDIVENLNTNGGEFLFSCSDMGRGISKTVREFLRKNSQADLRSDAWKHFSFTDCYKWAFTTGNSSSKNTKKNKGIGMTIIIDGTYNINMELSIWDAESMMLMPKSLRFHSESLNHEELRKKVFNTGNKVGFYYYGRLKF